MTQWLFPDLPVLTLAYLFAASSTPGTLTPGEREGQRELRFSCFKAVEVHTGPKQCAHTPLYMEWVLYTVLSLTNPTFLHWHRREDGPDSIGGLLPLLIFLFPSLPIIHPSFQKLLLSFSYEPSPGLPARIIKIVSLPSINSQSHAFFFKAMTNQDYIFIDLFNILEFLPLFKMRRNRNSCVLYLTLGT